MNIESSELDILIYWIKEREHIRFLKESGTSKPWTKDHLLRDFRWCNVRRMDDRVSRWLLDTWYPNFESTDDQLLAAVLARIINWPDALSQITDIFPSLPEICRQLHARKAAGFKVFTGAYVIPGVPGQDKIDSVVALVAAVQAKALEARALSNMRDTWTWLSGFRGLGSFLAGQIVADLAFLSLGKNWKDKKVWAPVGPGSARGLNRLTGRPKNRAVTQGEFEQLLPTVIEIVKPNVTEIWENRNLVAMDIQNCLCEFDKYRRLTLGEGKVRSRYDGSGTIDTCRAIRCPNTADMFSD